MAIDTRIVTRVLLAAALGGCGPRFALDRVPIEGGSPEQRAAVRDALSRFETWVGPGRVRLATIRFYELSDGIGEYGMRNAKIGLDPRLSPESVDRVMRHELCHALDYQENLLNQPVEVFDDVIVSVEADFAPHVDLDELGGRRLRGEVFAMLCEQAPLGTAFLEHPCPGEPKNTAKAARWIREQVWSGEPDVVEGAIEVQALAGWDSGVDAESLWVIGYPDAAQALFGLIGEDMDARAWLSLGDGSDVDPFSDLDMSVQPLPPVPLPHGAPELEPWSPLLTVTGARAMTLGDQAVAIVNGVPAFGRRFAPQLLALDDGQWSVVQGACPTRVSAVFVAEGEPYLAWYEDQYVTWARVDGLTAP